MILKERIALWGGLLFCSNSRAILRMVDDVAAYKSGGIRGKAECSKPEENSILSAT